MNCSQCPSATMVYTSGGMYVECAALRAMGQPPARPGRPLGSVMVSLGTFFIPQECPNPDVPVELKLEFDARKTQPCLDGEGNRLPRRSRRKIR